MSDLTIERRMQELRNTAREYSKAKAEEVYLDEFKKSKLAILMKQAETEGVTSCAAQEREARAHDEYQKLLMDLKAATEESERLFWELQIARMGAGLWQTQQANIRAERKGYGT